VWSTRQVLRLAIARSTGARSVLMALLYCFRVSVSSPPACFRSGVIMPSPVYGGHETRSFSVSRGGRCSKSWSKVRPVMCEANAPKVSSGVSRWMFAMLFLAVFQTCSTGLWSGAYGGR